MFGGGALCGLTDICFGSGSKLMVTTLPPLLVASVEYPRCGTALTGGLRYDEEGGAYVEGDELGLGGQLTGGAFVGTGGGAFFGTGGGGFFGTGDFVNFRVAALPLSSGGGALEDWLDAAFEVVCCDAAIFAFISSRCAFSRAIRCALSRASRASRWARS